MTTPVDHHRRKRIVTLVIGALCVEIAMFALAKRGPALAGLIRPAYAVVAALFAAAIWHASRPRSGHDRRDADRRHGTTIE